MTDADLIYNALLRAEKRFADMALMREGSARAVTQLAGCIVQAIREEVGSGLAGRER